MTDGTSRESEDLIEAAGTFGFYGRSLLSQKSRGPFEQARECQLASPRSESLPSVAPDWEQAVTMIVQELPDKLSSRWKDNARLDILEKEVFLLRDRVERLERSQPIEVPVQSFAPDPYEVIKPLHVMVQRVEDDYIASFFDAEIAASGDTPEEAVFNLKDIIMACFESLTKHKETELGPGPRRQLAVLKDFIRRTA